MCFCITAQVKDSSVKIKIFTVAEVAVKKKLYDAVLDSNIFLNSKGNPQALGGVIKKHKKSENSFYIFAILFLLVGLLRTIFSRYFTTMFKVFFNTSLRQNQLTDQLEQAALPSLLFNIFFVFSIGFYIYANYAHFKMNHYFINWMYVVICIVSVAVCYLVKFVSLLFIGWLTNHEAEAKIYIFSIFLFNKIIGLFLLPFTMVMVFSTPAIARNAAVLSLALLAILLLVRFFKVYSLLQRRLKLNVIHFFMYIFSLEILPLLIIYKAVMLFFSINT